MFEQFNNEISCELCGRKVEFDYSASENEYKILLSTTTLNVLDKIDEVLNRYLVYRCYSCDQIYRYTYKDIERMIRKCFTEMALIYLIKDQMPNIADTSKEKFLVYCGKCHGLDGRGCCTKSLFDNCKLKRFPIDVF